MGGRSLTEVPAVNKAKKISFFPKVGMMSSLIRMADDRRCGAVRKRARPSTSPFREADGVMQRHASCREEWEGMLSPTEKGGIRREVIGPFRDAASS